MNGTVKKPDPKPDSKLDGFVEGKFTIPQKPDRFVEVEFTIYLKPSNLKVYKYSQGDYFATCKDLKTDTNIEFFSGVIPMDKIVKSIAKGTYSIAFFLYPVTMEQVKKVADNKLIMPPKSKPTA